MKFAYFSNTIKIVHVCCALCSIGCVIPAAELSKLTLNECGSTTTYLSDEIFQNVIRNLPLCEFRIIDTSDEPLMAVSHRNTFNKCLNTFNF